jgi:hypothetical protein
VISKGKYKYSKKCGFVMVSCVECGVEKGTSLICCQRCNKVHFCKECLELRANDVKGVFQIRIKAKWHYDIQDMKSHLLRAHTVDYSREPVRYILESFRGCLSCSISKITDGSIRKPMLGINKYNVSRAIDYLDTNSCFTSLLDIWTKRKKSL